MQPRRCVLDRCTANNPKAQELSEFGITTTTEEGDTEKFVRSESSYKNVDAKHFTVAAILMVRKTEYLNASVGFILHNSLNPLTSTFNQVHILPALKNVCGTVIKMLYICHFHLLFYPGRERIVRSCLQYKKRITQIPISPILFFF